MNSFCKLCPVYWDNTLTNDTQSINATELKYFILLVKSLSYNGCVKTLSEVPINIPRSLTRSTIHVGYSGLCQSWSDDYLEIIKSI